MKKTDIKLDDIKKLKIISKKLEKLFTNPSYDTFNQKDAIILLDEFARITKYYEAAIEKETNVIKNGLSIVDKKTGKKEPLIDIDGMESRVKSVLNYKNERSPLRSLAITNKCVHSLDPMMKSYKATFINMYKLLTAEELKNVVFVLPAKLVYKRLRNIKSVFIDTISNIIESTPYGYSDDTVFLDIYKTLGSKSKLTHINQKKRFLTNDLKISFTSDKDAEDKFNFFQDNREELLKAYLYNKYNYGKLIMSIQNNMYSVKSHYILTICKQLKEESLKNIKHELVKTEDGEDGYKYMIVIDEPKLSYFIEVHMPDDIKYKLVHKLGFKVTKRTTLPLGASAVYERIKPEIKKVYKALKKGKLKEEENKAVTRGKVITRGYSEGEDPDEKDEVRYFKFKTVKYVGKPLTIIPEFLKHFNIHRFDQIIDFCNKTLINENYSASTTKEIVNNYHYAIYNSLTEDEQIDFIEYGLYIAKYDDFDKQIIDVLRRIYESGNKDFHKNLIPKTLLYKRIIREDYKLLSNYNKNYDSRLLINDYIEHFNEELYKIDMENNNGRKR